MGAGLRVGTKVAHLERCHTGQGENVPYKYASEVQKHNHNHVPLVVEHEHQLWCHNGANMRTGNDGGRGREGGEGQSSTHSICCGTQN